ncbi:MAG: CTP synthase, partial [Methanospirillaceae archaeon]|nr:CTP synthase [Methanospirillaceae archaeon]
GEVDLDLGNYERFLDIDLGSNHNITTGKVYRAVIEKERHGDFLGQTVQIIPHITDQIIANIKDAAHEKVFKGKPADICLVEVGGTVGDIESMPFLEAVRQMRSELPPNDRLLVHVTLMPSDSMGDLKTKPTQHSVKELRELGLHADIIVGRSDKPISLSTKKKLSALCDIPQRAIISNMTVPDIYQVPLELEKEGLSSVLSEYLGVREETINDEWYRTVSREYTSRVTIAIVTKYGVEDVYLSIKEALKHAGRALSTEVEILWVDAERLDMSRLSDCDGVLIPGGFGFRGTEGKISAIRFAREQNKPFLGLCLGFQLAVVEFARNSLRWSDACSSEFSDKKPVITILPEQEGVDNLGGTMRLGDYPVSVKQGTRAHAIYKSTTIVERHRHRYEVEPLYIEDFENAGLIFSGTNGNRMEILEIQEHPFFFASQFHPEFKSRPTSPSPPFLAFVTACKEERRRTDSAESPVFYPEARELIT